MAYDENLRCISLNAATTTFASRQYHLVKAGTTAGTFVIGTTIAAGALNTVIGVLQDAPTAAGEACSIAFSGVSKVICGSTKLSPGDFYICGTSGRAASTASATARDTIYGPWLSAAAAAGSIGSAFVDRVGITT